MSPCIGPKDCGIARRCKLFLGTEFERGALVLEDPSVWPPLECPREFAAANLNAESYLEREHNARWAAFGVAHAAHYGQCIDITFAPQPSRARLARSLRTRCAGQRGGAKANGVPIILIAKDPHFPQPPKNSITLQIQNQLP